MGAARPAEPGALASFTSTRGTDPFTWARTHWIARMVRRRSLAAEARLRAIDPLWSLMVDYARGSAVTGASYSDYLTLWEHLRAFRPREVLECGSGISTVVLAEALRLNEAEGAPRGRVTSMEDDPAWHEEAMARLPHSLAPYVEHVLSPKVDGFYKCFRGVQYQEVPERTYDFVFSDGPDRHSPVNGDKLFDLDLLQIVRRSENPVRAVVDDHFLTFYVLQTVFGPDKARYSPSHKLLFVGPVTRHDVRRLSKRGFLRDLRPVGPTRFTLRLVREDE
jgi:Methyltransferase domain